MRSRRKAASRMATSLRTRGAADGISMEISPRPEPVEGHGPATRWAPPLLARHPHLDAGFAGAVDAELPRGFLGEVDRPAVAGAAIVDPHGDRAAVPRVGHPQFGLEGQRGMGGGQFAAVEALAARRAAALQLAAVPRGDAG